MQQMTSRLELTLDAEGREVAFTVMSTGRVYICVYDREGNSTGQIDVTHALNMIAILRDLSKGENGAV